MVELVEDVLKKVESGWYGKEVAVLHDLLCEIGFLHQDVGWILILILVFY